MNVKIIVIRVFILFSEKRSEMKQSKFLDGKLALSINRCKKKTHKNLMPAFSIFYVISAFIHSVKNCLLSPMFQVLFQTLRGITVEKKGYIC